MSASTLAYLHHILNETDYLVRESQNLQRDAFLKDETLTRAFVRSLEIIGEATKQVPDDFKSKYSQVEWREMAGMRDRLIHGYFGVDYDIVWDAVVNKVPELQREIEQIIQQENS